MATTATATTDQIDAATFRILKAVHNKDHRFLEPAISHIKSDRWAQVICFVRATAMLNEEDGRWLSQRIENIHKDRKAESKQSSIERSSDDSSSAT